ncbi:hypothetical protein JXI42_11150 [bacterium]|nr:hypothetical protein [bacterium]
MRSKGTLFFLAVMFIIVGIVLTMENLYVFKGFSVHWPIFLAIVGCGFVMLFYRKSRDDVVLLWLGTFVLLLGAFFYYLNYTSWESLENLWPVFLGLIGISFLSIGIIKKNLIFNIFAISFIALYLIFTMVFSLSTRLWPMSFVIFGTALLVLEYLRRNMKL